MREIEQLKNLSLDELNSGKLIKASASYIHRKIAGNDVLISIGANIANFNGYIELNPSAVLLWKKMQISCTVKELAGCLEQEYGISSKEAECDVFEFLSLLLEHQMIEVLS